MKKFKFRLQRVIDVRETKKKECQRELSLSQRELERWEEQLKREEKQASESQKGLKIALKNSVSARELNDLDCYRTWQEKKVGLLNQSTESQRLDTDKKRSALIQASKDKKVLERLKERRLVDHQAQISRSEQAFLDEIGSRATVLRQTIDHCEDLQK